MSKAPTFNSLFGCFFTADRYIDAIKDAKYELIDVELVQKIIKADIVEFAETLKPKVLKRQVDRYGFVKACCEFNSNRENKARYVFRKTGDTIKYSDEYELEVYTTLFEHVVLNTPALMKKLLTVFKKAQRGLADKKPTKRQQKEKVVTPDDRERVEYSLSDEDDE